MAGVKISALPAVPSAALTDVFPVVQGGVTSQESLTQVLSAFQGQITSLGAQTAALNMNTHQINNVVDPTVAQDAATKNYVDLVAQGLNILPAAKAASTGALTVTYNNGTAGVGATLTNAGAQAAFAIDGYTASLNDVILIKNQATPAQNGVYTVTTLGSGATNWVLTRATFYNTPAAINPGDMILVDNGTVNAKTSWLETAAVATIGTDSISFSQFGATFPLTVPNGGTGLTTTTAYGIIAGGTTATGNFQNIGAGTSGQILQSGGAAALANWINQVGLTQGGTNASLTASNGGIFYSTASAGAILAGTATAGLALLSGASTTPSWSTSPPITQINVQRVTATGAGTYTPTSGMKYVIVRAQAGGGASGGTATVDSTHGAGGAGGGGGEYIEALFTAAQIGASKAYSVGAGGTVGTAGNNPGNAGSNTTFNTTYIIATGGGGGAGCPALVLVNPVVQSLGGAGGTGGSVATGTLLRQVPGGQGGLGYVMTNSGWGGFGGNAGCGAGGPLQNGAGSGWAAVANSGAGASGPGTTNSAALTGGAGGSGFLEFIEYISV